MKNFSEELGSLIGRFAVFVIVSLFLGLIFWGLMYLMGLSFTFVQITAGTMFLLLIRNLLRMGQ